MHNIINSLQSNRVIPVVVINDAAKAVPLAQALLDGGITAIEVTFRTQAAAAAIRQISEKFPQMFIGAGTLLTPEQVKAAKDAGATFGVAPGYNPEILKTAQDLNFPFIPGIATASELSMALYNGCAMVKFFPAQQAGGPDMLKALLGAFRHTGVKFMPTGGVDANNIQSWLCMPEVVACGGSWMVNAKLIDTEDWTQITALSKAAIEATRA